MVVIVIALAYALINGFHDGGNVFAATVSSRSVSPKTVLLSACAAELIFPIIGGTTVAARNTVKAKKLENELETLYRVKLKELVQYENFCFVFKMREVYRHISNLADRVDTAANTIAHIVVKTI